MAALPTAKRAVALVPTSLGSGSTRLRKIGIVALARKLMIELWRYLETGVIPEGAAFTTEVRIR